LVVAVVGDANDGRGAFPIVAAVVPTLRLLLLLLWFIFGCFCLPLLVSSDSSKIDAFLYLTSKIWTFFDL
jgi:hypothetical protein